MDNFLKRLIPVVKAQSFDAIAQPSFGSISGDDDTVRVLARIDLETPKNSFDIGETFTVSIRIRTFEDVSLNRLTLRVLFNPNILSVVDEDPNTSGTQIKLTETSFESPTDSDNSVDNQQGIITLIANSAQPINFSESREVAQIRFNTQTQGSTRVTIQGGSLGSRLFNNTQSVAFTSSETQITVSNIIVDTTPTPTTILTPTITTQLTPTPTPIPQTQPEISTIPDTSLEETIPFIFPIFFGLILLAIGLSLVPKQNSDKQ